VNIRWCSSHDIIFSDKIAKPLRGFSSRQETKEGCVDAVIRETAHYLDGCADGCVYLTVYSGLTSLV
jgi:hypothetical protein